MKRALRIVLSGWLLLAWLAQAAGLPVQASPAQAVRTVTRLGAGLSVSWQAPAPRLAAQADGSVSIQMDGYANTQIPGQPALPEDSALLALPGSARPNLEFEVLESESLPLAGRLALAPSLVSVPGPAGEQTYDLSQPAAQPGPAVSLVELGSARGIRLARLTFHPVRVNGSQLEIIRRVRAVLRYGAPFSTADAAVSAPVEPYYQTVAGLLINPLPAVSSALDRASPASSLTNRAGQIAIEVEKPGLTVLDYAALAQAGMDVTRLDPHRLRLERAGSEIATEWDGDDDTAFEPNERLLFYAQPRFSRWTARDVYYLSVGTSPGLRMASRAIDATGKPAGTLWVEQLFEENHLYTPECYCAPIPAGRDGDRWVWTRLRQNDKNETSADYTLDLAAVDETQPARLTVWVIGYTDDTSVSPNHRIHVELNGASLGPVQIGGSSTPDIEFSGKQAIQATITIPPGQLHSGSNPLRLSLPGTGTQVEGAWLDAFSVRYARAAATLAGQIVAQGETDTAHQYALPLASTSGLRAYDVSQPAAPVQLTGILSDSSHAVLADPDSGLPRQYALIPAGSLLTPAALHKVLPLQATTGVNYLIITHPDFASELPALVALRQSQGLRVAVEDVRAIYDAVSGLPDPAAIRAYLASWQNLPSYVLLVGDGTSDPRRNRGGPNLTYIPPYLAEVDPIIGETASDNRFATLVGDDAIPDLLIGRLPVNSRGEAAITITKIVEYARHPAVGGKWNQRLLFVADENDPGVGNFPAELQNLAGHYPESRYTLNQASFTYTGEASQAAFTQSVLAQWNRGNGLILYNGHASTQQWGANVFFHINNLPTLQNGNRLPVLLEMTCLSASFQAPDVPTLDETLLRRANKGVAAAWGSTGLGISAGHMLLARGFLDQVMADPAASLGTAALQGKLYLLANAPELVHLVNTFTLLGDPAMRLNNNLEIYLPLAIR